MTVKKHNCRVCGDKFTKRSSIQLVCSPKCGIALHRQKEAKKLDKIRSVKHKALKKKVRDNDKSFWKRKAQESFNRYIRMRDEGQDCISCQKPPKKKNAGHYRSVGAHPELRYEELNVHLQCEHCNSFRSGDPINYRKGLIKKIGLEKLEWLEGPHDPKRYTVEDYKAIHQTYREKLKELENEKDL